MYICLKVRTIIVNEGEEKLTLKMFEKPIILLLFIYLKFYAKHINAYVCRCVLNDVKPFGLAMLSPRAIDYLVTKRKKKIPVPGMQARFSKQYKLLL